MSQAINRAVLAIFISLTVLGCQTANVKEEWEIAPKEVVISPYKSPEADGTYLNVIYENFSQDTIRKLKYELITTTNGIIDTIEREIILKQRLKPKDRHLVTRPVSEKPINYDEVGVGRVWIVKQKN